MKTPANLRPPLSSFFHCILQLLCFIAPQPKSPGACCRSIFTLHCLHHASPSLSRIAHLEFIHSPIVARFSRRSDGVCLSSNAPPEPRSPRAPLFTFPAASLRDRRRASLSLPAPSFPSRSKAHRFLSLLQPSPVLSPILSASSSPSSPSLPILTLPHRHHVLLGYPPHHKWPSGQGLALSQPEQAHQGADLADRSRGQYQCHHRARGRRPICPPI